MPAGRSNAITLSFARKNKDVLEMLMEKKKSESFVQNDYICEAIRFYEKNKDKEFGAIDKEEIKRLVDERFEELKKELLNNNELVVAIDSEKDNFNNEMLEKNIDAINPMFFDED